MNIPVYEALITDETEGMIALSLVDEPAVETNFIAFEKHEKQSQLFSVVNPKEQMILGVVMRADFPIYRRSDDGFEYYIKYSKETIKKMCEKFLSDGLQNNINLMHNQEKFVDGVELTQIFIKDIEKGINPSGFENIEDGSLFAQYHITNQDVWESVENGDFKGYSLEAFHTVELVKEKENYNKQINKTNNMLSKIKETLKSLLVSFGTIQIDDTTYYYEGEEIVDGTVIYKDEEMTEVLEDGTYGDYTIVDGKVSIKEEEIVEETVEAEEVEEVEDVVEETVEEDGKISALEEAINALKGEIETIKSTIDTLNKPIVEPIEEQFSKIEKEVIDDKWSLIAKAIKNNK